MSVSTTLVTKTYDAAGNVIQTVGAGQGAASNIVQSPLTTAAVNPNVAATGVSNNPRNASSTPIANLKIGAGTGSTLASWSNPA